MAKLVATDCAVVLNGVDLSDHVAQVTVDDNADEVESTAFGAGGHEWVGGLRNGQITIEFHQDYDDGSVYHTIDGLVGSTTSIVVYPNGTTVGTANPSASATVLVSDWSPIDGQIGDLMTMSVTWPISGTVTYATA